MKSMLLEQKALIMKAAKMLQNMPTFKPYDAVGLKMTWGDKKFSPYTETISPIRQAQNYKLRWVAEALMGSLDSPKAYFLRQIERYRERYNNSPKTIEALKVIERFI